MSRILGVNDKEKTMEQLDTTKRALANGSDDNTGDHRKFNDLLNITWIEDVRCSLSVLIAYSGNTSGFLCC